MAKTIIVKPLGLVLRKAGLVSSEQVEKALKESLNLPKCKLGEILAIRGWIKPETADFFAETWPRILAVRSSNLQEIIDEQNSATSYSYQAYKLRGLQLSTENSNEAENIEQKTQDSKSILPTTKKNQIEQSHILSDRVRPLGQYLKAASLISDRQIEQILRIQQHSPLKFGKIAVDNKLISQTTLEFFLEHLNLIATGEKISMYPENVALDLDRIENYLLNNQRCEPVKILQQYSKVRQQGRIAASGTLAEQELLASGVVISHDNIIKIAKPSYLENFNEDWLEKNLASLQPYNKIRLKMFDLDNKEGISYKILNAVNYWTNHQPFLSQKLYQLIQEKLSHIPSGKEEPLIEELTYKYIIDNWQNGVAAEHFNKISDRIFNNEYCTAYAFLKTYKKIWQLKEINADNSLEQRELLRIGLIKLHNNRVSLSNLIYQAIFDKPWIDEQIELIEQSKKSTETKPLNNRITNISSQVSQTKKINYVLPIIGIITFLIAIPFLLKLIPQPESEQDSIEQSNLIFF